MSDLTERLLKMVDVDSWDASLGQVPRNPAGPEAAARIQSLEAELDKVRGALRKLHAACEAADANEELSDHIDGSLLDEAYQASYPLIWTDEQVKLLEARQANGMMHPYTCGNDRSDALHVAQAEEDGEEHQPGKLIPTQQGWICPACDYRQFWSHETRQALSPGEP